MPQFPFPRQDSLQLLQTLPRNDSTIKKKNQTYRGFHIDHVQQTTLSKGDVGTALNDNGIHFMLGENKPDIDKHPNAMDDSDSVGEFGFGVLLSGGWFLGRLWVLC